MKQPYGIFKESWKKVHCACFEPLNFGVFCYIALDNWEVQVANDLTGLSLDLNRICWLWLITCKIDFFLIWFWWHIFIVTDFFSHVFIICDIWNDFWDQSYCFSCWLKKKDYWNRVCGFFLSSSVLFWQPKNNSGIFLDLMEWQTWFH